MAGRRAVRRKLLAAAAMGMAVLATSASGQPAGAPLTGIEWPKPRNPVARDARLEARIDGILARMTVEEKVGQTIQGDIASVTPEDAARYHLGSILNGGNSAPGGDERAPASEWLKLADAFWTASMQAPSRAKVPIMWGTDAVHGHSNVVGATIFPHNIGLGAMRNPDLIRKIGEATALEISVTGIDWDFSPTLAVVRDDRWGRTYESFSEDPSVVRSYAGKMVEGLQGTAGSKGFLGPGKVIATAKHFIGDGGTTGGKDQGDNPAPPEQLRDIHGAGYVTALEAGAQSVMASFSSVRGEKVHGSKVLLTDVLRDRMGFEGLVVGDWNGHGQVPGCANDSCAASMNAGLDIYMAPDSWKGLYEHTLAQVRSGEIPMARLDEAVRRILRIKLRAGLFDKGKPSSRPFAGRFELLGSPAHRAVARQAVRESLVLLKNNGGLLPLSSRTRVLVAGDGADNIAKQSGGWTITWQGTDVANKDFPNGQSIWSGIEDAVRAGGGTAELSPDGSFATKPDVAIVVFGENPYAEFVGDRPTLEYSAGDKKDLELLKRLKAAGIPVVSVFLSGRPLWVNPELNASDAFVAAWLPGSEGGGIADVLFRNASGAGAHDFRGKLSFSWPKRLDQTLLNPGDAGYDPLFPFGYGLAYSDRRDLSRLSEERPANANAGWDGTVFGRGKLPAGWSVRLGEEGGIASGMTGNAGRTGNGQLLVSGVDRRAQEDARRLVWNGAGKARVEMEAAQPLDMTREANGDLSLVIEYRLEAKPTAPVTLGMRCGTGCEGSVPITGYLAAAPLDQWQTLALPVSCFVKAGADVRRITAPLVIATGGKLTMSVSDVRIASANVPKDRCGA